MPLLFQFQFRFSLFQELSEIVAFLTTFSSIIPNVWCLSAVDLQTSLELDTLGFWKCRCLSKFNLNFHYFRRNEIVTFLTTFSTIIPKKYECVSADDRQTRLFHLKLRKLALWKCHCFSNFNSNFYYFRI